MTMVDMKTKFSNITVLGLTGGIGCGKSQVAEFFRDHDVQIIDADFVGRELLEPEHSCWQALKNEFGDIFFDHARRVDRPALRKAIFSDEITRAKINELFHPLIHEAVLGLIGEYAEGLPDGNTTGLIVVEVPLLFESGWLEDYDKIIVVYADMENCLQRLMARDQVTREDAEAAIRAQMPLAEKVKLADMVIDNNGELERTRFQVDTVMNELGGSV